MVDPVTAITLGSLALNAIGGLSGDDEGEQRQQQIQGFAALPPQVQQAYLKQFLPGAQQQFKNGPTPPPLGRALTGKYSSKALQELQQYADNIAQERANNPQPRQQEQQSNLPPNFERRMRINELKTELQGLNPRSHNTRGARDRVSAELGRLQGEEQAYKRENLERTGTPEEIFKGTYGWGHNPQDHQEFRDIQERVAQRDANQAPENGSNNPMGNAQGNALGLRQGQQGGQTQAQGNLGPNGVRPLGSVEPFNQLQENAFDQLAQGHNPNSIESYVNPYSAQALNAYSGLINQGNNNPALTGSQALGNQLSGYVGTTGGMQGNQGQGGGLGSLQDYMNPYNDQVTNRTLGRIGQELQGGENTILGGASRLGGLGAFGSSALGTLLANRQNEALQRAQDFIAQQNQANYGQAQQQRNLEIDRGLGQRNIDATRQQQYLQSLLGGGNDTYRIAGGLQDVGYGQQRQSLQDMLAAGNQIQQHGQNELAAANPLIQQQLPQNRLNQFGQHLAMFPQSGQSFSYGEPQQNMWSRLGGVGLQAAGGLQAYQQGQDKNLGGAMPWLNQGGGGNIGGLLGNAGGGGNFTPGYGQRAYGSIGSLGGRV